MDKSELQDCVEKDELVARLLAAPPAASPAPRSFQVKTEKATLGGLDCNVVSDSDSAASIVAVFCHGFGAGGEDLVPLGQYSYKSLGGKNVKFVFPAAPIDLGNGGRAWYPLDLQDLIMRAMSGQIMEIIQGHPDGLSTAREKISALLNDVQKTFKVPLNRIVLGGFSQGATVSLDAALRLGAESQLAALVLWSPPVVSLSDWEKLAPSHKQLRVYHSHGKQDPIVPALMGNILQERVLKPNTNVTFFPFSGQHTIPPQAMEALTSLLTELAK